MFTVFSILLVIGFYPVPPVNALELEIQDVFVLIGEPASLVCTATQGYDSNDRLEIQMTVNGTDIGTVSATLPSLTLKQVMNTDSLVDLQTFTCTASGTGSTIIDSASFAVREKPDSPTAVTIDSCLSGSYQATVSWTPGENLSQVKHFRVEYNASFDLDQWTHGSTVADSETSATIQLKPSALYHFRVIAQNEAADSDPSEQSSTTCSTDTTVPWSNPEVIPVAYKKGYLVIKWKPMPRSEHNGPGFGYTVDVRQADTNFQRQISIDDWMMGETEIQTNDVFIPYTVTVKAKNDLGPSNVDAEEYTIYSGEDDPLLEVELLEVGPAPNNAATSVTLLWKWNTQMESDSRMQGAFHGFLLEYVRRDAFDKDDERRNITILKDNMTLASGCDNGGVYYSTVVEGLSSNVRYEARMSVLNTYYAGQSVEVLFSTFENSVYDLQAICCFENNSVKITWQVPNKPDPNGIQGRLKEFRIILSTDNLGISDVPLERNITVPIENVNITQVYDFSPLTYEFYLRDLDIYQIYYLTVQPMAEQCNWLTASYPISFRMAERGDATQLKISKIQILMFAFLLKYIS